MTPELSKPQLLLDPLFYDILSGEFAPTCDPTAKTHTLGRLMVAAAYKGCLSHSTETAGKARFEYTPSWTRSVGVRVVVESQKIDDCTFQPYGISLYGERLPSVMRIMHLRSTEDHTTSISIGTGTSKLTMPWSLNTEDLEATKFQVAEAANSYLETATFKSGT